MRRGQSGKVALAMVVILVMTALILGSCILLGQFLSEQSEDVGTVPLAPAMTLSAEAGSTADQLNQALGVLKRRLGNAGIPHAIEVHQLTFRVFLPEDSLQIAQAKRLTLAGGDLWYKLVVRRGTDLPEAEWEKKVEEVRLAREQGTYDPETSTHDCLPHGDGLLLLENPGFAGFYITDAHPGVASNGRHKVTYSLSAEGGRKYHSFAQSAFQRTEATILDDEVLQVSTWGEVSSEYSEGQSYDWVGETWTAEDAAFYANLITSGRLPIELSLEEE